MKLNLIFLVNNYHSEFILVLLPTANKNPSYFTPNHSFLSLSHPHSQTNSFTLSALQFPHQWVSVLSNLNTCFLHSSFHRFPNKHSFRCSSNCQVKTMGKTVVMEKKKKDQITSKYRNLSWSSVSYVQRKESSLLLKEGCLGAMTRSIKKGEWRSQSIRLTWQGGQELPTT